MAGAAADIAHLYLGEFMLELFQYRVPEGRADAAARSQADHGYIHFGLRVTDIHGETARLRAAGVSFLGDPVEFRPRSMGGVLSRPGRRGGGTARGCGYATLNALR